MKLLSLTTAGLLIIFGTMQGIHAEVVSEFSSNLNDYNFNMSNRYDRAVFARSENNFTHSKVYQVLRREDGRYSPPQLIELGPSEYEYSDPMLGHDGETLYYISNRPLHDADSPDDLNIWRAIFKDGKWQDSQPLPQGINSDADEMGPEVHNDTLYFSSHRKGYLSLYQARKVQNKYHVAEYQPLSDVKYSRSDLTFSPDGQLALFWELSDDKQDTLLMLQRKQNNEWEAPIPAPEIVQSEQFEFTPQFSPDGVWLYYSSGKSVPNLTGLNIHKIPSKDVFPEDWYNAHLASKSLPILASSRVLEQTSSFAYSLEITSGESTQLTHNFINFEPFLFCQSDQNGLRWTDGITGQQVSSSDKTKLPSDEVAGLMRAVQYNFLYLFKDQGTQIYKQYDDGSGGILYRVWGTEIPPFSMLLSDDNRRIQQLRYDDQALGLEHHYKMIGDIAWPMAFDYLVDKQVVATGRFFNVEINEQHPCQQKVG